MQAHHQPTLYRWEKFHGHLPANTVYADPAYAVIRAHHGSDWIVGKYSTGGRKAYIPWGGVETEIAGDNFEVLVHAPGTKVQWVPASHGQVHNGAIGPVGNDGLFVGRVVCPQPENKYTPGKIHPAHKCLYIPWGGKEQKSEHYECLTIVSEYAHYVNTVYNWEKFHGHLPANTVYADPAYAVIRAHHGSDWIVGKYSTAGHKAYIPWGGVETEIPGEFEVLVHAPGTTVQWVPCHGGQVPEGAVGPVGNDQLFVGRVVCPQPENKYTPGKIHPAHKCLYIPWGGKEHKSENYEALTIRWAW